MLSHITQPILNFFSNLAQYLLLFAIFLAIFGFIYLGVKNYWQKKDYGEFKTSLLFIILGIILLGIIFINRNIIFDLIRALVPKF